ncbi:MAG TPA: ABC transporter substrate-binding protein [Anaeromyxobacteraceae bacterium]|nr:ABC transporter substrate-binding protein [Anaeromyxobacteraceae bacterium]
MAFRALTAALAACFLVASPARAAPVPGVTDTEITIGITGPLSGPAAAWGTIALASEAYAKHVNDQGGVHGRKLKIVLKDDGYNPGRAVANLTEMKDSVFAVIGTVGTVVLNASKDLVAEAGLPLVFPLGNVQVFAKQPKEKIRTVFQAYPDYSDEAEFLTQQAAKLEKVQKLGFFGQNDDFGKEALEGVKRGLKKTPGTVLAGEVFYEVADRELGTHALKMKESGAEAVLLYSTATHAAGLVKEMAKVGYRPKLFASFTLYDRDTMFRLLGELWEGAYFDAVATLRGEPAADKLVEIVTRIEPKLKGREGFSVQGAADVMILLEGLKRTGRDLTREKFVKAMETIKDWTGDGLYAPMSFGPDRHHGQNAVRLMRAGKLADGSVKAVTDYQFFPTKF